MAFPFAEFHEVLVCPFLQPVEVPVNDTTTIWHVNNSSQFPDHLQTLEVHFDPSSRSQIKMSNSSGQLLFYTEAEMVQDEFFAELVSRLYFFPPVFKLYCTLLILDVALYLGITSYFGLNFERIAEKVVR